MKKDDADGKLLQRREMRRRAYYRNREARLKQNREWAERKRAADPEYFKRLERTKAAKRPAPRKDEDYRRYHNEANRRYRARHRDRIIEAAKAARVADPERFRNYHRARAAAKAIYWRAYREKNKEKLRAYWRAYYYRNRESLLAKDRAHYQRKMLIDGTIPGYSESRRKVLLENAIYAAADGCISHGLPSFARNDVISMIVLAVIENEITIEQIPAAARGFVSKYYKDFGAFGPSSLDAFIPGTEIKGIEALVYDGAGFDGPAFSEADDFDPFAGESEMD